MMVATQGDAVIHLSHDDQLDSEESKDNADEYGRDVHEPEVVDVNAHEKQENEGHDRDRAHKGEESEDEAQLFMGSTDAIHEEKLEEKDVVIVTSGENPDSHLIPTTDRSRANTNAMMAAKGYVTSATLEGEVQCIICQYTMFKPVSAICGHSFCRVCLLDSILTRSMDETQCPICRVDLLHLYSRKVSLASLLSVNVTLWNLIQLVLPSVKARLSTHQDQEEREFKRKLVQLDAKWRAFHGNEQAAAYHDENETEEQQNHGEFPVLKVEDTQDGNLHVSRTIVLDTSDENEDGYLNMRVGLAIVAFPSLFEAYNEHQECSVNVLKMEEDEENADGMPWFMQEDGDDDALVCDAYYNELTLCVCDEAGNCVMERTRGAQRGVVTFPGLRLDVPGGRYTFRFSDNLYGLKLSISTRLREPHEMSDTPVADYVSLLHEEARDGSRRHRRRRDESDSEVEADEDGNESDDSFIVNDSDAEGDNDEVSSLLSDDDKEDEAHAVIEDQRRRRSRRKTQFEKEDALSNKDDGDDGVNGDVGEEDEESESKDGVRSHGRNVQVVDDAVFSSDSETASQGFQVEEDETVERLDIVRPRPRHSNQIVDSDDEEECQHVDDNKDREHGVGGLERYERERSGRDAPGEADDADFACLDRKVKREQWVPTDESTKHCRFRSVDNENEQPSRKRSRHVRIIAEVESDEEKEEMERSILTANCRSTHDDNEDEDDDVGDFHYRRVHHYNEEDDEQEECNEAVEDEESALSYYD